MVLEKCVIGIEFGSTNIKAVMLDENHEIIASNDYSWESTLKNGIWIYTLEQAKIGLADCYAGLKQKFETKYRRPLAKVGAIGISGMMHGYLVFDKNGNQLAEFRTWKNTICPQAQDQLSKLFNFNVPQRWSVSHIYQAILNNEKEVKVLNTLLSKQVDGIIFMGNEINDKLREEFKRTKTPIVFAGSVDEEDLYARVNIDYVAAVQEEVKNLIDRGNRRVAFVCGPLEQAINGKFRLKGYKQALKSAGIPYDEKLVFETDDTYKTGTLLQPALMAVNATAAMVTDDELAAGIMNGMSDADVKVPDDFEIITSNDTKLTEMVRPKMSSITQPLYDIGAVAMRLLTKLMHNEPVDEKNVLLPYGLMKRESTK